MKKIFALALMLHLSVITEAANYYFSTTNGNDSRTALQAQNQASPWKTISKLNSYLGSLKPGDQVLFYRGDVFYGTINVTISGTVQLPILFSDYGNATASLPVISGLVNISGWTTSGNGVWEAPCTSCATKENVVLINDKFQPMGRYPNSNAANKGYLNLESHSGNTQITDNELTSSPNWTGAELVIKPNRWVIDRDVISSHSGTYIIYTSASTYEPGNGFGYFIQNSIYTLDQQGEWYFDSSTKKMKTYFGSTNPASSAIQAATVANLVYMNAKSNITFNNLNFTGSNEDAFMILSSQNITISNCIIKSSGTNAITAGGSSGIKILNNKITGSNNMAVYFKSNCTYANIENNSIKNTGVIPGMGSSGNNMYGALMINGNNNTVASNTIDSSGYNVISFTGNNVLVKNNYINYFTLTKDDGGGIYTYAGSGAVENSARTITGNIIMNGMGAGAGTDEPNYTPSEGIYMDDNSGNVVVSNNTVANCGGRGIYLHNAHAITLTDNTLYNNKEQLRMDHDNICPTCYIQNNKISNNIMVSRWVDQNVANYTTTGNDIINFGTFDNNYYCRPFDDNLTINTAYYNGSKIAAFKSLQSWQSMYSKDLTSHKSPLTFSTSTASGSGVNQFGNSNFNTNIKGLYSYSALGNTNVSFDNTGILDGGALKFSWTSISGQINISKVIIGAGAVTAGKKYVLKYSMKGTKDNVSMNVFLRQSLTPFAKITSVSVCPMGTIRTENEYVFYPTVSEKDMSIIFEMPETNGTVYIDNIKLYEETSPNQYSSGDFNSNINGLYSYSALNNTKVEWTNNSKLEGGSLKFSFTSNSGQSNNSKIIIGAGSVTAGKQYVLRYSLLGAKNNKTMNVFLRQSLSPFNKLSAVKISSISDSRTEIELIFSALTTESDMSIIFEIPEQDSTMWFDNIRLNEAAVSQSNPDDFIRFEYNPTATTKTILLATSYIDVKNNPYSGSVSLAPYTSIVLLKADIPLRSPIQIEAVIPDSKDLEMNLFPNPVSDLLNVFLTNAEEQEVKIEIYNLSGALVLSKNVHLNKDENKFQFDMDNFKAGIYILKVIGPQQVYQKKFVRSN